MKIISQKMKCGARDSALVMNQRKENGFGFGFMARRGCSVSSERKAKMVITMQSFKMTAIVEGMKLFHLRESCRQS